MAAGGAGFAGAVPNGGGGGLAVAFAGAGGGPVPKIAFEVAGAFAGGVAPAAFDEAFAPPPALAVADVTLEALIYVSN